MLFEFLIPRRPVSLQTKNRTNLQLWKTFVSDEARKDWSESPYNGRNLHLTLVYLCDEDPVDVDNIIKPIQDALVGTIYDDDLLISDVESHRRPLTGIFDITKFPPLLVNGLLSGAECVYVRITDSQTLENYLS
jgi:Endodeoxyribonuclease RusA.